MGGFHHTVPDTVARLPWQAPVPKGRAGAPIRLFLEFADGKASQQQQRPDDSTLLGGVNDASKVDSSSVAAASAAVAARAEATLQHERALHQKTRGDLAEAQEAVVALRRELEGMRTGHAMLQAKLAQRQGELNEAQRANKRLLNQASG